MSRSDEKNALFEELARVGKALANGKRMELLDLLAQAERSVESLADAAALNLTTASAHLQTLRRSGLVATRREGTRIYYRLAGDDVVDLLVRARAVAARRLPDVDATRDSYFGGDGDVETVSADELIRRMASGQVTMLDVRPAVEFAAGHLPGAINIPVDELADRLAELPTDREVVAYCRGPYCVFAHDAVRMLHAHGRTAVRLAEGVTEWHIAGQPVAA